MEINPAIILTALPDLAVGISLETDTNLDSVAANAFRRPSVWERTDIVTLHKGDDGIRTCLVHV